jgi:hypothetical protein
VSILLTLSRQGLLAFAIAWLRSSLTASSFAFYYLASFLKRLIISKFPQLTIKNKINKRRCKATYKCALTTFGTECFVSDQIVPSKFLNAHYQKS